MTRSKRQLMFDELGCVWGCGEGGEGRTGEGGTYYIQYTYVILITLVYWFKI